jgi:hypothetical protein
MSAAIGNRASSDSNVDSASVDRGLLPRRRAGRTEEGFLSWRPERGMIDLKADDVDMDQERNASPPA